MQTIELHFHVNGTGEPKNIHIEPQASVDELIKAAFELGLIIGELEESLVLRIENEEKTVNRKHSLADCGIRHGHHIRVIQVIIVNGEKTHYQRHEISFDEVAKIAYADYSPTNQITYKMTYKNGPRENRQGSMVPGQSVRVKNHMIFNVSPTGKS